MVSGDILAEARRRAGLTQAELGRRSGVGASLIGRYERFEVIPSLERLRDLVRACGLELSFRIANADPTDHDLVLVDRQLAQAPGDRLRQGVAAARAFGRLAGRPVERV